MPDVLKKQMEYAEAKVVLKDKKIRFQMPFPVRFRVLYQEGVVVWIGGGGYREYGEEGVPGVSN